MADAAQATKRYLESMGSGMTSQKYKDGVTGTTVNPMELAAAADDLYLMKVQESVTSGRRAAALRNTPKSRWTDGCINKGAQRLTSGAQAAQAKVQAHFAKWTPIYNQAKEMVRSMPKGTEQDAVNRVAAVIRLFKQSAGKS